VKTAALTVTDILNSRAEFDHSLEVRSTAPALVLILERDAPLRMELLASTEAEHKALQEECGSNPRWHTILEAWYVAKDDEFDIGARREDDHAERLDAGQRLSTLRVTDERDSQQTISTVIKQLRAEQRRNVMNDRQIRPERPEAWQDDDVQSRSRTLNGGLDPAEMGRRSGKARRERKARPRTPVPITPRHHDVARSLLRGASRKRRMWRPLTQESFADARSPPAARRSGEVVGVRERDDPAGGRPETDDVLTATRDSRPALASLLDCGERGRSSAHRPYVKTCAHDGRRACRDVVSFGTAGRGQRKVAQPFSMSLSARGDAAAVVLGQLSSPMLLRPRSADDAAVDIDRFIATGEGA
jgi:hypothetical protein